MGAPLVAVVVGAAAPALPPFEPSRAENLNGAYHISPTPGAASRDGQPAWARGFRDYPNGTRYFDAWSPPFSTLYSQVWWKALAPLPIPDDVAARYAGGRIMAVVGFEADQVIRGAGPGGGDLSVPISASYNHHFDGSLNNARKSELVRLREGDPRLDALRGAAGHGVPHEPIVAVEHTPGAPLPGARDPRTGGPVPAPTSVRLGGGNGGEYRKTFHGWAPNYVSIVESPTEVQMTPMQIDTWHRDAMPMAAWGNRSAPVPFVPGPVPRHSLAPARGADAVYSGLLECPVTTRITKHVNSDYDLIAAAPACPAAIQTAAECFAAAPKAVGAAAAGRVVDDAAQPPGCSVRLTGPPPGAAGNGSAAAAEAVFNAAGAGAAAACAANATLRAGGTALGPTPSPVGLAVTVDLRRGEATLRVWGPADVWFGVGFGASSMKEQPWTVVVDGAGGVTERVLADHAAGTLLPAAARSARVVSAAVAGGTRTVVLRCPTNGSFDFAAAAAAAALPFISAVGSGADFGYHKAKAAAGVALLPVGGAGACVCARAPAPFGQSAGGALLYTPAAGDPGERGSPTTVKFYNKCAPQPRGDLLAQRNPTCDVRAYTGGQIACQHMFSLLDADQPIPWPDQPLTFSLKFRFWYQDYDPDRHTTVKYSSLGKYTDWSIGAGPMAPGFGAEYDVPKCAEGVAGCAREGGTWVHTISGAFQIRAAEGARRPVVAHLHCHAPTCLSMAVYNNDTGALLCEETSLYGAAQGPRARFDEPGYIAVPPCVWGSPADGLEEPPDLTGVTLRVVKRANATHGHHGEMAHGEIYYVDVPARSRR